MDDGIPSDDEAGPSFQDHPLSPACAATASREDQIAAAACAQIFSVKEKPPKTIVKQRRVSVPVSKSRDVSKGKTDAHSQKLKQSSTGSKSSDSAPVPSAPPSSVVNADILSATTDESSIDADEEYGEHEKALNEFTRMHPMLSLESTSAKTLQMLANLVPDTSIPVKEVPIVPRSHDEIFLCPAQPSLNERACSCGDRCIARWLAIWRYGHGSEKVFTCKEYLLPDQYKEFMEEGTLPEKTAKCLLCSRYFTTYVYRLARLDPQFKPSQSISLQAYGNVVCEGVGTDAVTSSSEVGTKDGYLPSAMLFVDEQWSETTAARGDMGALLWRPVLKFCASHYKYVLEGGKPRIVQVGVAANEPAQDFGMPAARGTKARPAGSGP